MLTEIKFWRITTTVLLHGPTVFITVGINMLPSKFHTHPAFTEVTLSLHLRKAPNHFQASAHDPCTQPGRVLSQPLLQHAK